MGWEEEKRAMRGEAEERMGRANEPSFRKYLKQPYVSNNGPRTKRELTALPHRPSADREGAPKNSTPALGPSGLVSTGLRD